MNECSLCNNCPYRTDFSLLEARIKQLEEDSESEHSFHEKYYADQRERIKRDAEIDLTLKHVDEKLDKLLNWKEEQVAKPAKRMDSLLDKILLSGVGAAVGYIIAILFGTM